MKNLLICLFNVVLCSATIAQKPIAASCTKDHCYKFSVDVQKRGSQDRLYFVVTNKDEGAKDIELFVEVNDGKWYSQGYTYDPVEFNQTTTFDRFGATGNYVIYYRNAGDNTVRFPTQSEVNERFGKKKYGYGVN